MKTKKSKRFLNLATLCLALLGTTLLMAHPVKAEAIPQSVVPMEGNVTQEGSSEDQVLNESGFVGTEAQKQGYKAGYNDAINGRPQTPRDELEVPKDLNRSDEADYKDGYGNGYNYGWEKNHPIEVAVMDFFNWVLSFFGFNLS